MTFEEKLEVKRLFSDAHYALTKAIPTDTSNEIVQAVWARLISSLSADLAEWTME